MFSKSSYSHIHDFWIFCLCADVCLRNTFARWYVKSFMLIIRNTECDNSVSRCNTYHNSKVVYHIFNMCVWLMSRFIIIIFMSQGSLSWESLRVQVARAAWLLQSDWRSVTWCWSGPPVKTILRMISEYAICEAWDSTEETSFQFSFGMPEGDNIL